MLTKLIGYEMKAFGRIILPLYAATIGLSFMIGLGYRFLPSEAYANWIGGIVVTTFVVLIIATMVMTAVLCVQRFYHNLLGNEGYLMFSLPVGTHTLILSKALSALIWNVLGCLAGLATVAAMAVAALPMDVIGRSLHEIRLVLDRQFLGNVLPQCIIWAVISILSLTAVLMQLYAALAIGHQWTAHRILGSILAYFGIDIVKSIVQGILSSAGIHMGFTGILIEQAGEGTGGLSWMQGVQLTTAIQSVLLIVIFGVITWVLLDRRLNLE